MVVLKVTLLEGRSLEKKRELVQRLTEMAARLLGEDPEEVRVILYEVPRAHWAVGGRLMADREGA
ncbi:MAG: 2-hydroxymuconate tautomerase family protein [Thermus sp.]|uniref:tautomerase family protein n=1 Tax=unclassified Thermus TaxID=2619321 RepID=UPI00023895CC|nr:MULTISPECIES: 2-hydroxymuconate tautomerase family protein [unclassified Thermus]AEV16347.1 4-oxalocrotonate tautomerase [Thermus sp. CCB_US3_UF1]MCS6868150.1 2-hydroxymuconate tautomerase family protein [Thermus sp.]MCS7219153.1 2-hydroxymuconate tautomerase family protein [Thermus sp.]MCX7849469.1 2-hydroxymuconate tautomerase family protein [Thermus sp.]MDW8017511.1 2-hydroxymuconate tautomerase family protein [Thermus sp.]